MNKSEEIGWPPRQNVLCHFPGVVIPGPVVSHIDEGLGITYPPNALQPRVGSDQYAMR
jgi:hypothetical protein